MVTDANADRILSLHMDENLPSSFLSQNILSSQTVIFSIVMYGCDSWTIKKAKSKELMLLNCGVGEDS